MMAKAEGISVPSPSNAVVFWYPINMALTTGKSFKIYSPLTVFKDH